MSNIIVESNKIESILSLYCYLKTTMATYTQFQDALIHVIILPHFKDFISKISPKRWAVCASNGIEAREDLIAEGCSPFGTFDKPAFIDLAPVFRNLGIYSYSDIIPLLDQLCTDADMVTVANALNCYILTALIALYETQLKTEFKKWFHKNKHGLVTRIQTRVRCNNAMWQYPILDIIR